MAQIKDLINNRTRKQLKKLKEKQNQKAVKNLVSNIFIEQEKQIKGV